MFKICCDPVISHYWVTSLYYSSEMEVVMLFKELLKLDEVVKHNANRQ